MSVQNIKGDLLVGQGGGRPAARHAVPTVAGQSIIADPTQADGWVGDYTIGRREAYMRPAGAVAETVSRAHTPMASLAATVTGTLYANAIVLPANRVISSITFHTSSTALGGGSNQWFALIDNALNVLAKTADDISAAWGTGTAKPLAISTSVADAAITSGANSLSSATAAFTAAHTGRKVTVLGAGAAGAPLGTGLSPAYMQYVDATHVTLFSDVGLVTPLNAGTTVSGATAYIGAPVTTTYSGLYYIAPLLVATTMPTWEGIGDNITGPGQTVLPALCGSSTASLTTPASLGGTIAALTTPAAKRLWGWVS